jgi:hypothetical protein
MEYLAAAQVEMQRLMPTPIESTPYRAEEGQGRVRCARACTPSFPTPLQEAGDSSSN